MALAAPRDYVALAITRVESDRFLTPDAKTELKANLSASPADAEAQWQAAITRPRDADLTSQLLASAATDAELGHLAAKEPLLRHLARSSGADYRQLLVLLEGLRGNDLAQDAGDALSEWDLLVGHARLRQRSEAWFFAAGGPPLQAVPLDRLPCCLGLHSTTGEIFLGFEVPRAALTGIRASCVLDVTWDYLELWRSSGSTEPSCDPILPSDRGFPEYLAVPPLISDLAGYSLDIIAV